MKQRLLKTLQRFSDSDLLTVKIFFSGAEACLWQASAPDFPAKFFLKFVWCVWATRLSGGSPTQVFGCGEFQKERLSFFGYGNFQRERLKACDCGKFQRERLKTFGCKGFVGLNFVCKLRIQGGRTSF